MFAQLKNFFHIKPKMETAMETKQEPFRVGGAVQGGGEIEIHSSTWVFMENWAKSEIDRLRKLNDGMSLSVEKTTAIRGQIKLLKRVLLLPGGGVDDQRPTKGRGILTQ